MDDVRTCLMCSNSKPMEDFHWKCKAKGKRYSYCKECWCEYTKKYYLKNREAHLAKAKRQKKANSLALRNLLHAAKSVPCADCAVSYPPWVMDFDHLDGSTKVDNISNMVRNNVKTPLIKDEMLKCEVVCSNCHRQRTWRRMQEKRADWDSNPSL